MKTPLTLDNVVRLARRAAWGRHSGLAEPFRGALRAALAAYDQELKQPTSFDHIMADDDIFDRESKVQRCAYAKCQTPMTGRNHGRRVYHSDECRKKAFHERKAQKA